MNGKIATGEALAAGSTVAHLGGYKFADVPVASNGVDTKAVLDESVNGGGFFARLKTRRKQANLQRTAPVVADLQNLIKVDARRLSKSSDPSQKRVLRRKVAAINVAVAELQKGEPLGVAIAETKDRLRDVARKNR